MFNEIKNKKMKKVDSSIRTGGCVYEVIADVVLEVITFPGGNQGFIEAVDPDIIAEVLNIYIGGGDVVVTEDASDFFSIN
jgi:hypothetical protein